MQKSYLLTIFIPKWSETNLVFISERNAPADFISVWKKKYKINFMNRITKINKTHEIFENLYIHSSHFVRLKHINK